MPEKSTKKRGRGRPAHVPTAASRRKVAIAAGGGMLHEQIAIALEISTDTLRKYYEHELSVGASQRRVDVLEALYRVVIKKGSTSAAKVYLANEPQLAVPPAPQPETPAPTVAPTKLGKKEQADVDAKSAGKGTEWAELLRPAGTPVQ